MISMGLAQPIIRQGVQADSLPGYRDRPKVLITGLTVGIGTPWHTSPKRQRGFPIPPQGLAATLAGASGWYGILPQLAT